MFIGLVCLFVCLSVGLCKKKKNTGTINFGDTEPQVGYRNDCGIQLWGGCSRGSSGGGVS